MESKVTLLDIQTKLAERWSKLVVYWTGPRMVGSWQTLSFIENQAYYCTVMAVRAARVVN